MVLPEPYRPDAAGGHYEPFARDDAGHQDARARASHATWAARLLRHDAPFPGNQRWTDRCGDRRPERAINLDHLRADSAVMARRSGTVVAADEWRESILGHQQLIWDQLIIVVHCVYHVTPILASYACSFIIR